MPKDAFRERLDVEYEALKGNVERLHNFVNGASFDAVSVTQQGLLKQQLGHMEGYQMALRARIDDLNAQD